MLTQAHFKVHPILYHCVSMLCNHMCDIYDHENTLYLNELLVAVQEYPNTNHQEK